MHIRDGEELGRPGSLAGGKGLAGSRPAVEPSVGLTRGQAVARGTWLIWLSLAEISHFPCPESDEPEPPWLT